jgi:glycerol-3-phosphate dehydrogenase (NAD(P)+)
MMLDPIAVIGAGAWGTALANAAAETGREVLLWGRDGDHVSAMVRERCNTRYLPGIALADGVAPISSLAKAAQARLILLVVPAQSLRSVARDMAPMVAAKTPVVACAKGIERATGAFMTQVIADVMPGVLPAILSGPSFADDVARGLPTAVTLAAADEDIARGLAQALSTQTFRVYHSTDMRGVEIGGAAKNVLAIAAGVVAGLNLGESARAALVARGFAELTRFARAFGGRGETLMGLSGLGDLVLTCGSEKSRNFALGLALGRGKTAIEVSGGKLAEGAFTASVLAGMAVKKGIDMPIVTAVDALLQGRMSALQLVNELMSRPVRAEG